MRQLAASGVCARDQQQVAPPSHHDVVLGGMRLRYLDWGTHGRSKVLFLHGGGLNARTWDPVCDDLRRDYHCYAIDMRGHGDSEWSPTLDYGLGAHVRDLQGFIEYLATDRVVLVGHSLGGHAALRYASQCPNRVSGLVVIDTSPFFRGGPPLKGLRDFMTGANDFDSLDEAIEYVRFHDPSRDPAKLRHTLMHSLRQLPDGRWTWKRDQRPLNDRFFANALEELQSLREVLRDVGCPTLVVRGQNGALEAEEADRFRAGLPDGRAVTVEGAGHNVQTDNPAGLVAALRPFLAEARKANPHAPAAAK